MKVKALNGFEFYPDGVTRTKVLAGEEIEVTDDQAALLRDHGHIEAGGAPTRAPRAPAAEPEPEPEPTPNP